MGNIDIINIVRDSEDGIRIYINGVELAVFKDIEAYFHILEYSTEIGDSLKATDTRVKST